MYFKYSVHYRLPEQCCANCEHSYLNSYGDCQCRQLEPGAIITEGAVCDVWKEAPNVPNTPADEHVVIPPYANKTNDFHCKNCMYSFYNGADATCARNNKIIIDIESSCKHYAHTPVEKEEMTEQPIERIMEEPVIDGIEINEIEAEPVIGTCSDCAYSRYQDGQPYCIVHEQNIEPDLSCENWIREGSIVIMEGVE
jgi:hypothetical protein